VLSKRFTLFPLQRDSTHFSENGKCDRRHETYFSCQSRAMMLAMLENCFFSPLLFWCFTRYLDNWELIVIITARYRMMYQYFLESIEEYRRRVFTILDCVLYKNKLPSLVNTRAL
jgi:hypothetical protein